jgi:hypothetical protein
MFFNDDAKNVIGNNNEMCNTFEQFYYDFQIILNKRK